MYPHKESVMKATLAANAQVSTFIVFTGSFRELNCHISYIHQGPQNIPAEYATSEHPIFSLHGYLSNNPYIPSLKSDEEAIKLAFLHHEDLDIYTEAHCSLPCPYKFYFSHYLILPLCC
jgi:hypothetical protein